MGLNYLDGAAWSEVTRDERFFCAHLYMLIEKHGVSEFVSFLNRSTELGLDPAANWEVAFEACFYRDFLHAAKKPKTGFSLKRTFDLCLFSDETIIIIEAKAHGGFDEKQMSDFDQDEKNVAKLTGVENVFLLALVAGKYNAKATTKGRFKGWLEWENIAEFYGADKTLKRAGEVFRS